MTYQLLNENYVPARNLKNTNIRNVIFFKCLYLIYHLIGIQTHIITNCPTSQLFGKSSATSYPESPRIVWFKAKRYFHSQFKHTEYSAHLLRRSNAYLFRKSTCTRSALTKLLVSKLQRQSSMIISPSMFILTLQPFKRKLPPVPWQPIPTRLFNGMLCSS